MGLESIFNRFGFKNEVKKPSKIETFTSSTPEEFTDLIRTKDLHLVKGFVNRQLIPGTTGVSHTLLTVDPGYYNYEGVLTAQDDNKVIVYREDYGDLYGSSVSTGFINRENRERTAIQTLVTVLHRLKYVSSRVPGIQANLIDLSTGNPFTQDQLGTLEKDRRRLGVFPLERKEQ